MAYDFSNADDFSDRNTRAQCQGCGHDYETLDSEAGLQDVYCSPACQIEGGDGPEPQDGRQRGDDDGQEYGDPRDEMDADLLRD